MSSLVGGNPWGPGLRLTLQVGLILPLEVLWVGLSKCCQTNRTHLGQPLSVALIRVTGGVAYPLLVGKLPQDPLGLPCVGLQELQLGRQPAEQAGLASCVLCFLFLCLVLLLPWVLLTMLPPTSQNMDAA